MTSAKSLYDAEIFCEESNIETETGKEECNNICSDHLYFVDPESNGCSTENDNKHCKEYLSCAVLFAS